MTHETEDRNFADAPISITEARSGKDGRSQTWTVRDALIAMLREMDRGEIKPEQVVIIWTGKATDGEIDLHRSVAGPYTTLQLLGMLTRELWRLNGDP